ncbi:flavin reductase family protein [Smaragdicoccus niigatensis]|uniref:flavin reductase family protein n=1 Tax=Smaragdicoccus niigatensis TaxID=359359 RepID=UPI00037E427B|nr:flavin reductase family protein [Smaragdicoccus niigatensis]
MDAFGTTAARLDYPVYIVTTAVQGLAAGCLVGFAMQASIRPARFLIGISNANETAGVAARASHLAVHVVDRRNMELARLFGEISGDDVDKFDRCFWHPGPNGLPILDTAAAWFGGRILDRIFMGDHTGYLITTERGEVFHADAPLLTLADVRDFHPGHEVR